MIDIEKAIVAMASNEVDFVVIGGIALSIPGLKHLEAIKEAISNEGT